MSETTEEQHEEKVVATKRGASGDAEEPSVRDVRTESVQMRRRNTLIMAVVAVFAISSFAAFLWWRQQSGGSGAGRPVPAPRTISLEQPNNSGSTTTTASSQPTLSLAPDQAQRAGIKVEPVGEQLSTEGGGVATGVVQPNAYRETPVISLVGGIVRSVGAELGQNVGRGQTLAVVFSDELAAAQSRYVAAVAELDEHHRHHQRTVQLVEIGAASREEFEQATTKLKTAESDVASLRQRLLLLGLPPQRVDTLRSASQISSDVAIRSPVAGTVTSRAVNQGEVVEANKELLKVTDLSSVWVVAQVYEKDLGRIRTGSGASVTSDAYPNRVFRGSISYVDPRLDPQTRTAQVRIELANPGRMLKIGMYVNVAFATSGGGSESTVPVVPLAAVQNINNQQVVFVATDDPNVFAMRPIRVGAEINARLPVLEGLSVGERIVTEGSFSLRAEWLKQHPGGM